MLISIVIPIYNEENNIARLHEKLSAALETTFFEFEAILVNDGSTDGSGEKIEQLAAEDDRFKVISLRRNFGQTAAMMAGFDHARGDVIVPMDGDLQNDPADIPRLVNKLHEGYDVCSGWRRDRKDNYVTRSLPSCLANSLISWLSGVKLHDYGCTMKAYRKDIIKDIRLYGEMHRFIPIYAHWMGAKITEIPVSHHPRTTGRSKYGIERTFKVLLDLMFLMVFLTLSNKPIYIFGAFGFLSIIAAFLNFFLMVYFKFSGKATFIETPLPQLVVLFFLVGFISILMGFIAEILMRTYYESQGKTTYTIKYMKNII